MGHLSISIKLVVTLLFIYFYGCDLKTNLSQSGPIEYIYAQKMSHYYAHKIVTDSHGIIAPWYQQQNGQLDARRRITWDVIRRYPWTTANEAISELPYFIFTGLNTITPTSIKIPKDKITNRSNGDIVRQATFVVNALIDYYMYTGEITTLPYIEWNINHLIEHCIDNDLPLWPQTIVSIPQDGQAFYKCNSQGEIQIDYLAGFGEALIRAHYLMNNDEWLSYAKKWGDNIAKNRIKNNSDMLWPRYADQQDGQRMTGGVAHVALFLKSLLDNGYTGENGEITHAYNDSISFIKSKLLPQWASKPDTWGRTFWDWVADVQSDDATNAIARLMINNPDQFPNWQYDVRNIMGMMINHSSTNRDAGVDMYHGAWQYSESSRCCLRSIGYPPLQQAWSWALYGNMSGDENAKEVARRIAILSSYDFHTNGRIEDLIDGGAKVSKHWFKIAHPFAMYYYGKVQGEIPLLAPQRENHILKSDSVVTDVQYGKDVIEFKTAGKNAQTQTTLRITFPPEIVSYTSPQDGDDSAPVSDTKELPDGDYLLTLQHQNNRKISIRGTTQFSYQRQAESLLLTPNWNKSASKITSSAPSEKAQINFFGNQLRITGELSPNGGKAHIFIDGIKQKFDIDFYHSSIKHGTVYLISGLEQKEHEVTLVVSNERNRYSTGNQVTIFSALWSDAIITSIRSFGEGGGSSAAQRVVLGYDGTTPLLDGDGNKWMPGTDFVVPLGNYIDSYSSWWSSSDTGEITGTVNPNLYRYGVHAHDFKYNFTVKPSSYCLRLMFSSNRAKPTNNSFDITVNNREVVRNIDIKNEATNKSDVFDLIVTNVEHLNGSIQVRLSSKPEANEAFLQAIELSKNCSTKSAYNSRIIDWRRF